MVSPKNSQTKVARPVLIVSCIWLLVWLWSALFVQPNSVQNYQQRTKQALEAAEIVDEQGNIVDLTNWLVSVDPKKLAVKRRALGEASLYLRRLIDVMPDVSDLILRLAMVSEASSKVNAALATVAMQNGEVNEADNYRRKSMVDAVFAEETMERIAREESGLGVIAKSWELARSLRRPIRDDAVRQELIEAAQKILDRDEGNRVGRARFAQLRVQQAYDINSSVDSEQRQAWLEEAVRLAGAIEDLSLNERAILAEALDGKSPEQAIEASTTVAQRYWSEESTEGRALESLTSAFASMIRLGSLQESLSLFASRLSTLPMEDQMAFRGLCSDFCMRYIECQFVFPSEIRRARSSDVLSLSARIDTQSTLYLGLLTRLVAADEQDMLASQLMRDLREGNDQWLFHLVLSARAALEKDRAVGLEETRRTLSLDRDASVTLVSLLAFMIDDHRIDLSTAVEYLEMAEGLDPDAVGFSFAVGMFFEKHEAFDKAAACFEKVRAQTKNDPKILSMLMQIYLRLDRPEDVKRIQAEIQQQRKRSS